MTNKVFQMNFHNQMGILSDNKSPGLIETIGEIRKNLTFMLQCLRFILHLSIDIHSLNGASFEIHDLIST